MHGDLVGAMYSTTRYSIKMRRVFSSIPIDTCIACPVQTILGLTCQLDLAWNLSSRNEEVPRVDAPVHTLLNYWWITSNHSYSVFWETLGPCWTLYAQADYTFFIEMDSYPAPPLDNRYN